MTSSLSLPALSRFNLFPSSLEPIPMHQSLITSCLDLLSLLSFFSLFLSGRSLNCFPRGHRFNSLSRNNWRSLNFFLISSIFKFNVTLVLLGGGGCKNNPPPHISTPLPSTNKLFPGPILSPRPSKAGEQNTTIWFDHVHHSSIMRSCTSSHAHRCRQSTSVQSIVAKGTATKEISSTPGCSTINKSNTQATVLHQSLYNRATSFKGYRFQCSLSNHQLVDGRGVLCIQHMITTPNKCCFELVLWEQQLTCQLNKTTWSGASFSE